MWFDPNEVGANLFWWVQRTEDITTDLLSFDNPKGAITNSDIELVALVLQDSVLPQIIRDLA